MQIIMLASQQGYVIAVLNFKLQEDKSEHDENFPFSINIYKFVIVTDNDVYAFKYHVIY